MIYNPFSKTSNILAAPHHETRCSTHPCALHRQPESTSDRASRAPAADPPAYSSTKPETPQSSTTNTTTHSCESPSCSHQSADHSQAAENSTAWPDSVVEALIQRYPDKANAIRHIREATSFENYAALSVEAAERLIRYSDGILNRLLALSPFLCWSPDVPLPNAVHSKQCARWPSPSKAACHTQCLHSGAITAG